MKFGLHTIDTKGSLYAACTLSLSVKWKGSRWGETVVPAYLWPSVAWLQQEQGVVNLEDFTPQVLAAFLDYCEDELSNSQQTINHKKGIIRTVFEVAKSHKMTSHEFPYTMMRKGSTRRAMLNAWWLRPDLVPIVTRRLIADDHKELALYILWTVNTGLRVEENLRLEFNHLNKKTNILQVPGSKTTSAATPIPISNAARIIFDELEKEGGSHLFPFSNIQALRLQWRNWFIPTIKSTLTSGQHPDLRDLRATFASMLDLKGTPVTLIQQLLRHDKIETTMGYLRKTGDLGKQQALAYLNSETSEEATIKMKDFVKSIGWNSEEMKHEIQRKGLQGGKR